MAKYIKRYFNKIMAATLLEWLPIIFMFALKFSSGFGPANEIRTALPLAYRFRCCGVSC